jgi:hypothetical protein
MSVSSLSQNNLFINKSYDTGWIAITDWTNTTLGSTGRGTNITHSFNTMLSNLIVKVYYNTTATDISCVELMQFYHDSGRLQAGVSFYETDLNTVRIQTGQGGVTYCGTQIILGATGGGYYKVVVYNTQMNAVKQPSYIRRTNGNTRGATNTNVVIFNTAAESSGSDITYVNSAANGDSFLINTSGVYSVSWTNVPTTIGVISEIRTGILDNGQGDANTRSADQQTATAYTGQLSWTGYVTAGNSIWAMSNGAITTAVNYTQITIVKVY